MWFGVPLKLPKLPLPFAVLGLGGGDCLMGEMPALVGGSAFVW